MVARHHRAQAAQPGSRPLVAFSYERFSTERQDCESIETQRQVNKDYIERQGWIYGGSFSDDAVTGMVRLNRPGYAALLERVDSGAVDVVVATETSRLSRDPEETQRLWKKLEFHRIALHCPFDGGVVDDVRLLLSSYRSKEEVKKTRARTRSAQATKAREGRSAGGLAYGYRVDTDRNDPSQRRGCGHLKIVADEAAIVIEIFELYAAGWSCQAIADHLNDRGVPPPRSGKREANVAKAKRQGKPATPTKWRAPTIAGWRRRGTGILNNVRYIGRYKWGELEYLIDPDTEMRVSRPNDVHEKVETEVPEWRIVPQALWDAVKARQAALDAKLDAKNDRGDDDIPDDRMALARAANRPKYALSGLVRCGCCGAGFGVVGDARLGCSTYYQGHRADCANKRTIKRAKLEAAVLEGLKSELMQPEAIAAFVEAYNAGIAAGNGALDRERDRLEREAAQVERELANILEALRRVGSSAMLLGELQRLEGRKGEIEAQLGSLPAAPARLAVHPNAAELYRRRVEEVATLLADPKLAPKVNEVLRQAIDAIVMTPGAGRSWRVEVRGVLPGLFRWARSETAATLVSGSSAGDVVASVELVAGARNHLILLIYSPDFSAWRYAS